MLNFLFKALALASCFAPFLSHAVNVSSDGTGEALIYPYYNVRNGNLTLLSVVNNDTQGKAVKVAFREGRNGAVVLNFNLFLSPKDMWTAALFRQSATGAATLITADQSCTNPPIPANGVAFSGVNLAADTAPFNGLDRTTEGYLEIVEMASIVPNSALAADISPNPNSVSASRDCRLVTNASIASRQSELDAPRGKLSGNGTLVTQSMSTGYSALALQGLDLPTLVTESSDALPAGLTSARSKTAVITEATPKRTYTIFAEFDRSIDAISAVLTHASVRGEYSVTPRNRAGSLAPRFTTDLVTTFPTKFFYTNSPDAGSVNNPFTSRWNGETACEITAIEIASREGRVQPEPDAFSVGAFRKRVCFATTITSFGSDISSVASRNLTGTAELGAPLSFAGDDFPDGIATLKLGRGARASTSDLQSNSNSRVIVTEPGVATREIVGPVKLYGLPVVGFGITSAQFPNSRDNYNSSFPLTGSRVLPE